MDFLIFGTTWFWMICGCIIITIMFNLDNAMKPSNLTTDYGGGVPSTLLVITGILLYGFFGSWTHLGIIGNFMLNNPSQVLLFIMGYYFLGMIWSMVMWYIFLTDYKEAHLKNRTKDEWYRSYIPKASKYQSRIITWMTYWPISLFWTAISNGVRRSFTFLFDKVESVYNKITDSVFKDHNSTVD